MTLKYRTLRELYSLTDLTRKEIAKRHHISPNTMRKWKSIEDDPGRILYKIENLAIYKSNRRKKESIWITFGQEK